MRLMPPAWKSFQERRGRRRRDQWSCDRRARPFPAGCASAGSEFRPGGLLPTSGIVLLPSAGRAQDTTSRSYAVESSAPSRLPAPIGTKQALTALCPAHRISGIAPVVNSARAFPPASRNNGITEDFLPVETGRHGQIRTADLSLRRRPLYPSELRARNTYIVPSESFATNVGAVMHALEMNLLHRRIGAVDGGSKVRPGLGDAEDAAARGF